MYDIDFVITWVDGSDPAWLNERAKYIQEKGLKDEVRFRDWGLLKYWFRGVDEFAPWVRKVHFVTWGHVPDWLDTSNPRLNIVCHKDFIPPQYLPTFNSHPIELNLHRIEGLSEHFVYFNDDMFVINKVTPDFYFENGIPKQTFGLRIIRFASKTNCMVYANEARVINDHFDAREVYKKRWKQFFSYKNGKKAIHSFQYYLVCRSFFPGFINPHVYSSFLKSSFEEVWKEAGEVLDDTCYSKFREETNVGPTLILDWQYVKGNFVPRSNKDARVVQLTDNNVQRAKKLIEEQAVQDLCINDTYFIHDFERLKEEITESFEKILPNKCSFEK